MPASGECLRWRVRVWYARVGGNTHVGGGIAQSSLGQRRYARRRACLGARNDAHMWYTPSIRESLKGDAKRPPPSSLKENSERARRSSSEGSVSFAVEI